jgi:hypothetical protein
MAVPALTLPEARKRVDWLANYSAELHIGTSPGAPDAQEVVQIITEICQEAPVEEWQPCGAQRICCANM